MMGEHNVKEVRVEARQLRDLRSELAYLRISSHLQEVLCAVPLRVHRDHATVDAAMCRVRQVPAWLLAGYTMRHRS